MRLSPKWLPPILVLLAVRSGAAADDLSSHLPPETKVVIGVQVRTIADALSQTAGADLRGKTSTLLAQTPLAGFDPLKDLDQVLIASTGTGDNPPTLAILRGRFDVARLGAKAKPYHGVPVLDGGQSTKGLIAFLDEATALAGDPALVRAGIDRRAAGAPSGSEWAGRIESLSRQYAVWGTGEVVPQPRSTAGQSTPFDAIDRFQFGAAFANGLELTAELHARSAADLERMASALRMLEAMVTPQAGGSRFDMQTENGSLRLSVRIPQAELAKAIESQRAAIQSAVLSQLPPQIASQLATRQASPASRTAPAATSTIVSNAQGETLVVTLPGAKQ